MPASPSHAHRRATRVRTRSAWTTEPVVRPGRPGMCGQVIAARTVTGAVVSSRSRCAEDSTEKSYDIVELVVLRDRIEPYAPAASESA